MKADLRIAGMEVQMGRRGEMGDEKEEFSLDPSKFADAFQRSLAKTLAEETAKQPSKRTPPATEAVLRSLAVATAEAAASQNYPSNQPIEIEVSADKCTELMRELVGVDPRLSAMTVSPCVGAKLDFQARLGDQILVNGESELQSARERADDLKKVLKHEHPPLVTAMVWRGKSANETLRIRQGIMSKANSQPGPFVSVGLDWRANKPLNSAEIVVDTKI